MLTGCVSIVTKYPDLDCVFLNSGTQAPMRLSRPAEVDLAAFHAEINVNFTCIVDLCVKFAAHLLDREYPTSIIITGTHLSLVPAVTLPAYSSSKAALRAFFDCMRRQNQGKNCKFVELSPPVVQSEFCAQHPRFRSLLHHWENTICSSANRWPAELHDYAGEHGRKMGMPLDEFIAEAYPLLASGQENINIKQPLMATPESYAAFVSERQRMFDGIANALLAQFEL